MNHLVKIILSACLISTLAACSSRVPHTAEQSNFLTHYEQLQEVKTPSGNVIKAWKSEQLDTTKKQKLIFTPIEFKPLNKNNKIGEKFSEIVLNYTNQKIQHELEKHFELTQQSGPNILHFEGIVTAIDATPEDFKFYEALPVILVVAGTQLAVGSRDADTNIYFEWKVTNSVTHAPLYEAIRKNKGTQLSNTEQSITLEDLKEAIDTIADEVVPNA